MPESVSSSLEKRVVEQVSAAELMKLELLGQRCIKAILLGHVLR